MQYVSHIVATLNNPFIFILRSGLWTPSTFKKKNIVEKKAFTHDIEQAGYQ